MIGDYTSQAIDESVQWDVTLFSATGEALDYEGDEEIVVELWPGGGLVAVANPTATWVEAPDQIRVTIEGLDEIDPPVRPGLYQVRCMIDDAVVAQWATRLTPALTDESVERVLCTFQDMTEMCPQVMELEDVDSMGGFRQEREQARREIERIIKSKGKTQAARRGDWLQPSDDVIDDAIDDGRYVRSDDVVRMATAHAVSLVLAKAMSATSRATAQGASAANSYLALSRYHAAMYESILLGATIEVALVDEEDEEDLDYSYQIPLGSVYVT